ncbi:hypothetical protein GNP80_03645 [Aliivibrio fischeri]|nr:hypothetical protein [Aliivibrio fischeri]MUK91544.1 hypothetical protein [Aliivibrio fischeri]
MSKDKFLAKMTIAFMQNHGVAPTESQLDGWLEVYAVLENKGE